MSTIYNGLTFKTPLEAQWAAFFDLAGWVWHANPSRIGNWAPDFRLEFECEHSECGGSHTLLASVLPVSSVADFGAHPCLKHSYGVQDGKTSECYIGVDGGAALGNGPDVSRWEISHGAGGGVEDINFRVGNAGTLWIKAGSLIG